ncbi:MAG: nucleotidyltransferase family protein [Limnohabitans sp.]|nr:nucleotidyltransferase family protein [Limnohabitans sp.]
MKTDKQHIVNTLIYNKLQISNFGISRIGLFGSYVRNEQHEKSDIDIFVDFQPQKETFDNFMELCFFLDDLFSGIKVEVVTKNGLSPIIGPKILKEVEYV